MLAVYRGHINNHILHPEHGLGGRKLSQFTAKSVGEFRDRIRTAGVSVPTSRKILATLHSVLQHAIGEDWLAVNVVQGIKGQARRLASSGSTRRSCASPG